MRPSDAPPPEPIDPAVRAAAAAPDPERARPSWSTQVARVAGVPVRIHVTFWLLLLYLGWASSAAGGSPLLQVGLALSVFLCIALHEFAHVLVARAHGIPTRSVTLYPIGGISRIARTGEPREELGIALAGPLLSLAIGGTLWAALAATGSGIRWDAVGRGEATFLEWLAVANLTLGAFNLLPAFPMDGGRVLRAALALRLGRDRATRVAAGIGQGFAVLLGAVGLLGGNWVLAAIAVFLFLGARGEAMIASLLTLARGHAVREAMITDFEPLAPDAPLRTAVDRLVHTERAVFPVVDAEGRLVGVLTPASIVAALSSRGAEASVRDAIAPVGPALSPTADLGDAVRRLAGEDARRPVPVLSADRLVGLLTWENLMEFLAVERASSPDGDGAAHAA